MEYGEVPYGESDRLVVTVCVLRILYRMKTTLPHTRHDE